MAAVKINTGDAYHEDRLSEAPREKWDAILAERRYYLSTNIDYDCRCLVQYVAEAEEFYAELGYESAEALVREAYEIKPEQAWAAVAYLNGRQGAGPVGLTEAVLGSHGGDRRSEQARQDQGSDHNLEIGRGTAYLKARLQRDHPEIAEALDRGEYRSARAAAIEAGIIRPVPTVRLVDDLNKVASKLKQHLPADRLAELVSLLS